METKHTSTPWKISERLEQHHNAVGIQNCGNGTLVATLCHIGGTKGESNATFIVRACNVHDELMAVIEALGENGNGGYFNKNLLDSEWCVRAKAALAKARGESA